jgi:hypothetical protein
MQWVLAVHAETTLFMTGLIWFVQVVHYPLFAEVGRSGFGAYERSHTGLTTVVVAPPMLGEVVCATLLVLRRPASWPSWAAWVGLALLALIWGSTIFLQMPRHGELSAGFDEEPHRMLVMTNWIRTLAWTARGGLVLYLTFLAGEPHAAA